MTDAGGRPKLLKRPERRRALMDAAARAFVRAGYAATSMDDVAAEAGVTRVLIYRHFDSKTQLYRAVLDDTRDKLLGATGAPDRLKPASLDALVRVAQTYPDEFRLFFRHASREPEFREHADWLRLVQLAGFEVHDRVKFSVVFHAAAGSAAWMKLSSSVSSRRHATARGLRLATSSGRARSQAARPGVSTRP